LIFACATGSGTSGQAYGHVDVAANGDVLWIAGATRAGEFVSLDTISFWSD